MLYCCDSVECGKTEEPQTSDPIILVYQYFQHSDPVRQHEIDTCLCKNVENPKITSIYLLNETIFDLDNLGIDPLHKDKIKQINVEKRLTYLDVLEYVYNPDNGIHGYIVIINADIFLDETVGILQYTDMHIVRKMWALQRWDIESPDKLPETLPSPSGDSQDTWIFHTNHVISPSIMQTFDFGFGVPGCDNRMIFVSHLAGFQIVNDPLSLRAYHYHTSNLRNYDDTNRLKKPYGVIYPIGIDATKFVRFKKHKNMQFTDNYKLFQIVSHPHFMVLKPDVFAMQLCMYAGRYRKLFLEQSGDQLGLTKDLEKATENLHSCAQELKKIGGVSLNSIDECLKYASSYLKNYENATTVMLWNFWSKPYSLEQNAHAGIFKSQPDPIWAGTLNAFLYLNWDIVWTHGLRGKRILIITQHSDLISKQIGHASKVYGKPLFPQCTFRVLPSPAEYGDAPSSQGAFKEAMQSICTKIDKLKNKFDVALVSAGGFSVPLCNYIYQTGASSIYMGDALLALFGVVDSRFEKEQSIVYRVYHNEYWVHVPETDEPGHTKLFEIDCL